MTMNAGSTRLSRSLGIFTVFGLLVSGLVLSQPTIASAADGPAPNEQRNASTVTADPLPTVQIDSGIVWTQTIIGDTVYAAGLFSNARPAGAAAGTNLIPRSNILSYNINTGVITSFAPAINGEIKTLASSPDGKRLYVGGTFTTVNGQSRFNIAAFDTASGALVNTFKPSAGGSYVNAIVATNTTVYAGGLIGAGNGVTRKNFVAFQADTGALLGWAPTSDLQVDAMVISPTGDKLIAGGRFSVINDSPQRGLVSLDLVNGSSLPWQAPSIVKNGMGTGTYKGKAGIFSLTADATAVYGTGWVYANAATGNLEGTFAADAGSGAIKWIADCHGDHYGVYSDGTNVYTTSHQHACESMDGPPQANPAPGNLRHATAYTAAAKGTLSRSPSVNDIYADWSGYPAPAAINWYPDWVTGKASGQGQAGWTVTGNGKYVVVGGEFPYVNGKLQQGLVRFSNAPSTGAKEAPRLSGDRWPGYTARSNSAGNVRVSIPANWDRDDLNLTYRLYRNGTAAAIQTKSASSRFWDRPTIFFQDTGRTPGSTQTYRIVASDTDGNTANSSSFSVVVSGQAASPYAEAVADDGANLFWRLGTAPGSPQIDWASSNDGTVGAGVSVSSNGAIAGDPSNGSTFNGTGDSSVYSSQVVPVGSAYTVEFWVKTATTTGGKIVGYGRSSTGDSGSYDRHVYMTNDGRLVYGNYDGSTRTVSSSASYNDNKWHHVVATQGDSGMSLYVDGASVGTLPTAKTAEGYTGYWRVGGDNLNGWPDQPSTSYFSGDIDEVAVYPAALSSSQAANHYALGQGLSTPTADFGVTTQGYSAFFDASGSSAPSGQSIASYAWEFGDGSPAGSGVTPSHTYAQAGSFTATLTVTTNTGRTSSIAKSLVTQAPHAKPVAVISSSASGLTGSFDGSGSTASDGATITGYQWSFGDGSTSTSARVVHAYEAAGNYSVTLTVTDSLGATSNAATASISVTHAAPSAAFSGSVSGLVASVDGSSSTASDGATLSYSWNWGDGSASSSGVTSTHAYSSAGSRTVTLTVTDSKGSSTSASQQVTTTAQAYVASDDFERASSNGWGVAPVGGSWSAATGLSVAGGAGKVTSAAGQTRTTLLSGANAKDLELRAVFSFDKVANGGGSHFNLLTRKSSAGDYRLKVRVSAAGVTTVNVAKVVGTTETLFPGTTLPGYTYQAGAALNVRLNVVSNGATTALQAKVWPTDAAEPTAWTTTASDGTASLQAAGQIGVSTYLTGSVTNGPLVTSVDGWIAQ